MRWLRSIIGPQPVQRLIALLLALVVVLLFLLLRRVEAIDDNTRYPQDVCGSDYDPCEVNIRNGN